MFKRREGVVAEAVPICVGSDHQRRVAPADDSIEGPANLGPSSIRRVRPTTLVFGGFRIDSRGSHGSMNGCGGILAAQHEGSEAESRRSVVTLVEVDVGHV
jgi:hypothetical protein